MPRLMEPDPPLPELITVADALAAGLTRDQVRHRVRSGRWQRVGAGHFVATTRMPRHADRFTRQARLHVERARAAAARYPGAVVAFESAAATDGLPVWTALPERPSVIVPPEHPAGFRSLARLRHAWLPDHHVNSHGSVTTPQRTWIDVARVATMADALVLGDAGLRLQAFTTHDLTTIADECASLVGAGKMHAALQHLSALRESPLESASWAYFLRYRLPLPAMQITIRDRRSLFVGRVDFLWQQARLVGECDGLIKYQSPDDLVSEKQRQDRLLAAGFDVVRWGARDLAGPDLARRIREALKRRSL